MTSPLMILAGIYTYASGAIRLAAYILVILACIKYLRTKKQ